MLFVLHFHETAYQTSVIVDYDDFNYDDITFILLFLHLVI